MSDDWPFMSTPADIPLSSPRMRSHPPRKLWLFRLLAVMLAIAPFLLLEGGLRLAGMGHDLSLVIPVAHNPGWYQLNPLFDQPYFGQADLTGPQTRPFQLPKPDGVTRILVVGGSTVVGFPYAAEVAFPAQLELLLSQADSSRRFEVLNAGMVALNSSTEVAVVEEGMRCQPDVIVVYTGHNEFYGPGGVASGAGSLNPVWFRRLAWWKRLYCVQLGRRLFSPPRGPTADLMQQLSQSTRIPQESELFQSAVARFRDNLQAMIVAAQRQHIPIVLAAPVANERDQPPMEPAPGAPNTVLPAWAEAFRKADLKLQYDDLAAAQTHFNTLSQEYPRNSLVQYRLAQVAERMGNVATAAAFYRQALEEDQCRFRAPEAFRKVMADLARLSPAAVHFADLHAALTATAPGQVLGRRDFFEHVHFTFEGNRNVAQGLAEVLQPLLAIPASPSLTREELVEQLGLQPEEDLAALVQAAIVFKKPPLQLSLDADRLVSELAADVVAGSEQLAHERQSAFNAISSNEMIHDVLLALLRQTTDVSRKSELLSVLNRRRPWDAGLREQYAVILEQLQNADTAQAVRAAAERWPR